MPTVGAVLLALTMACSPPSAAAQTNVVRGVLLDVEAPAIDKVNSFTLRSDNGQEMHFVTSPTFNQGIAHLMTPGHMRQHMALADPIVVTYRQDTDGSLVALTAVDVTQ